MILPGFKQSDAHKTGISQSPAGARKRVATRRTKKLKLSWGEGMRTMIMAMKRTWVGAAMAASAAALVPMAASASEGELSDRSVQVFMDYAWSLTPQQFSKQDGTVIIVDKSKPEQAMVPVDVAREVIRVGRISAHAQVCNLAEEQVLNHRSLMRREVEKKKWTDQQTLYINQLHLTTVMLLTGKIRLVEKDGDKEVIVDETKAPQQSCSDEQRQKVRDLITAYVQSGPALASNDRGAAAEAAATAPPPVEQE